MYDYTAMILHNDMKDMVSNYIYISLKMKWMMLKLISLVLLKMV